MMTIPKSNEAQARRRPVVMTDDWKLAGEVVQPQPVILEWLKEYQKTGCIQSRDKVIGAHIRLVAYFARRMASPAVPFDDLMAEGVLRLMRCMKLYDAERGTSFSIYAAVVLRTNMRRSVARTSQLVRIPDRSARLQRDRTTKESLYYLKNGRPATLEDLKIGSAGGTLGARGLPAWCFDAEPEELEDEYGCPVMAATKTDTAIALSKAIASLPKNSAELICKRFGVLGERKHSVHELSARLGVSRQAVSHAITRACSALKEALAGDELVSSQLA